MGHFESSQAIKKRIENSTLVTRVEEAFNGRFDPWNAGSTVDIYHIGVLEHGAYVALRIFRPETIEGKSSLEDQIALMEIYCRNAELLNDNGHRTISFTAGVVYRNNAGLLVEDLSKGGTTSMEHEQDHPYGWITENGKRTHVFIDVDRLFDMEPSNPLDPSQRHQTRFAYKSPKYFSPGNFIRL